MTLTARKRIRANGVSYVRPRVFPLRGMQHASGTAANFNICRNSGDESFTRFAGKSRNVRVGLTILLALREDKAPRVPNDKQCLTFDHLGVMFYLQGQYTDGNEIKVSDF